MGEDQLFQIIRHFLNKEPVTCEIDWPRVWLLAKKHSLSQFVALYMYELSSEEGPKEELRRTIASDNALLLTRQVNQDLEVQKIHDVLEEQECPHLFLKGSVTRRRYAHPFYRTMSDIDFLYREEQHERVKAALLANGYTDYQAGRKNDTYCCKPYVCIEAHRQLVPSDSSFFAYCSHVWERAQLEKDCKYLYALRPEDELIFHMIHLAIHFLEGGAGIRFILDIFVYDHLQMDFDYVERELTKLDLLEFYRNVSALAENWFGQGQKTRISEKLACFIMENGTFGATEHSAALAVEEGRWQFLRRMCFPSYTEMCSQYPWLKNRKLFLPAAWIIRGFGVWKNKKGMISSQMKKARSGNKRLGKDLHAFYRECGLRSSL